MSLLRKPIFYITFVISFLIATRVFGWDFLGIWTAYQGIKLEQKILKMNEVDNTSLQILFLGIKLLKGDYYNFQLLKNTIQDLKIADTLAKLNVIDYLSQGNTRNNLEILLLRLQNCIDRLTYEKNQIANIVAEKTTLYQQCLSEKNVGDSLFFQWLRTWQYDILVSGLEQSANWWSCAEKNRIYAHAYEIVGSLVDKYLNILTVKNNILMTNKDLILQNLDLFKQNNLEKLLQLRNQIESINNLVTTD